MTVLRSGRALGLLLGAGLDLALGDPRRAHPVAAFGRVAGALEARAWADTRLRGSLFASACVGAAVVAGVAAERMSQPPWRRAATVALSTWAVLGGTSLAGEAAVMGRLLDAGDLSRSRDRLAHLCGRDAVQLQPSDLARATIESVAENTSDAAVAPLLWGAVLGTPGLLGYRAVNTLDSMVGHRNSRYLRFGWASARLDDLANLVPSRSTGVLAGVLAPLVAGSPAVSLHTMWHEARQHPSPNAGWCEAAFAGALGRSLGGVTVYDGRVEKRGPFGDGPPPTVGDIPRAVRLSRAVVAASLTLAAVLAYRIESLPRARREPV